VSIREDENPKAAKPGKLEKRSHSIGRIFTGLDDMDGSLYNLPAFG